MVKFNKINNIFIHKCKFSHISFFKKYPDRKYLFSFLESVSSYLKILNSSPKKPTYS